MLNDPFQRKIEYLRLSVIDTCNIRCHYCMPLEGIEKIQKDKLLSFEEITRVVRAFVDLGVKSVRITGGEPLIRKQLPTLIGMLHGIPGLEDLSLTTNGLLLKDLAAPLKKAGLKRLNVHLDTLDPARFKEVTRWGNIDEVLEGLGAAQQEGFAPIKLNAVLQKGINDQEIIPMAQFAAEKNFILRFIELMPIGPGREMKDRYLESNHVLEELKKEWTLLPYGQRLGRGPAEYFKIVELNSVIGLIHPVSQPFCDKCNRVRLSAEGRFQDCLAYEESLGLRDFLRTPQVTDEEVREKIKQLITVKRVDHGGFLLPDQNATRGMYGIGG